MHRFKIRLAFSVTLLILSPLSAQSQARNSDQLRELIDQMQFEQAYKLAQDESNARDDEYLLWKGVAALGLGQLDESQDLLEQFIRKHPTHTQLPRARLELALIYILRGEMQHAEAQLAKVVQANPPPNVLTKIKFLRALATQGTPWQFAGQLEFAAGHDSNANAGVTSANLVLPTLGSVTINSSGLKTPAAFQTVSGVATAAYRVNPDFSLLAVGSAELKPYQNYSKLNQTNVMAGAGTVWQQNAHRWRMLQLWQQLQHGGERYRDINTTNLEWMHDINGNSRLILVGSVGTMIYGEANASRNANVITYAADYVHTFGIDKNPVAVMGLSDSKESSKVNHPEFGRRIRGTKIEFSLEPWTGGGTGLQWIRQDIHHDGADPLYAMTRLDKYNIKNIYIRHKYNPTVSLQLDLQRLRNASNIEVWTHDRNIVSLKLRFNF